MKIPLPASIQGSVKTSGAVLIAANLIPLIGVFAWGWRIFDIVFLYWLENLVIGVLNAVKILSLKNEKDGALQIEKFIFTPFFLVHYGIFCFVHGKFVFDLLGEGERMSNIPALLATGGIGMAFAGFIVSHAFSFLSNFIGGGEYKRNDVSKQMFAPYGRVAVLHIAVLFGAFVINVMGSPLVMLLLLIGGKIALDLKMHARSHRKKIEEEAAAEIIEEK